MANPTSIMGANALSWTDAASSAAFQDSAGTIPAAIGDPVGYLADGVSGAYIQTTSARRPTLRAGYLENSGSTLITKALSRSGGAWIGLRTTRRDDLGIPVFLGDPLTFQDSPRLYIEYSPFSGFVVPTFNGGARFDLEISNSNSPVDTPTSLLLNVPASGDVSFQIGSTSRTAANSGYTAGTTTAIHLGGVLQGGGFDAGESADFDIIRFYILDAAPTTEQQTALSDWLENGDVGGGAEITGSGSATLAAATASGAAFRAVTGTGAATVSGPSVAGAGAVGGNITGSGAVTLPSVDATGAALRQANGDGTVTLPAGQASGVATREITGAGAADLPAPLASGAGVREVASTGAATLPSATGAGTGARAVTGTGEASLPALEAAGAATRTATGSGAVTLPAPTAYGLAGVNGALTASGDVTLPAVAASGVGTRTIAGSGAVILSPANVNAAATREIVGSGVVTLPSAAGFGSSGAAANIAGSGAATLPATDAIGAGAREVSGTGAVEMPQVDGAGAATRAVTGTGAVVLPFAVGAAVTTRQVNGVGTAPLPSLMAFGSEAILSGRRAALVGAPANRGGVVRQDAERLVITGNKGSIVQRRGN